MEHAIAIWQKTKPKKDTINIKSIKTDSDWLKRFGAMIPSHCYLPNLSTPLLWVFPYAALHNYHRKLSISLILYNLLGPPCFTDVFNIVKCQWIPNKNINYQLKCLKLREHPENYFLTRYKSPREYIAVNLTINYIQLLLFYGKALWYRNIIFTAELYSVITACKWWNKCYL